MDIADPNRSRIKKPSPAVIAQSLPGGHDDILTGGSHRASVGKSTDKRLKPFGDSRGLRLLEHQFAYQCSPWSPIPTPWEVSTMTGEPPLKTLSGRFSIKKRFDRWKADLESRLCR